MIIFLYFYFISNGPNAAVTVSMTRWEKKENMGEAKNSFEEDSSEDVRNLFKYQN